jgi:glutaredoxin-like protein NrdH
MMLNTTKVKGTKECPHSVMLFALSTCIWCKKTRSLLDNLEIPYEYIYVDLLSPQDEPHVMKELDKYNPGRSFPTIVIDGKKVIVGFKEEHIKDAIL